MNNCKYVRRKLQETIDYWERQLSEGNYKKEPTRKQILETIKYWENELRNPNSKRVLKTKDDGKKSASMNEDVQFKYFIQMYRCYDDGKPVDMEEIGYMCEDSFKTFGLKQQALSVARRCSIAVHNSLLQDAADEGPDYLKRFSEECHAIAVVKYGDEYENSICGCFIDGKPIPVYRIAEYYES